MSSHKHVSVSYEQDDDMRKTITSFPDIQISFSNM